MNGPWLPAPSEPPSWGANPGCSDPGWTGATVCRRPYGRSSYGRGPYGRCAIVGGADWPNPLPPGPDNPVFTPNEPRCG